MDACIEPLLISELRGTKCVDFCRWVMEPMEMLVLGKKTTLPGFTTTGQIQTSKLNLLLIDLKLNFTTLYFHCYYLSSIKMPSPGHAAKK